MRAAERAAVFGLAELGYTFLWVALRRHKPFHAPSDGVDVQNERKLAKRASSWYASTVAALIATLGSVPFVVEFAATRDLAQVRRREAYSETLVIVFIAYLVWDLVVGTRRKYLTLTGGYGHHIGYTVMLCIVLAHPEWSYLFALCSFMELPTFVLGLGFLFPSQRRDTLFLATFGATRLVAHAAMVIFLSSPYGRAHAGIPGEDTIMPCLLLSTSIPLHIYWFACGLAARKRSRNARKATTAVPSPAEPAAATATFSPPVSVSVPVASTTRNEPQRTATPLSLRRLTASVPVKSAVPIRLRTGPGKVMVWKRRGTLVETARLAAAH